MPLQLIIFCTVVLGIFAALDIGMIVSLVRPGDERSQLAVWKAGSLTLLGMTGAAILDVIENFVRSQPMAVNPFVQLEVAAILYFIALLYYKRKLGG